MRIYGTNEMILLTDKEEMDMLVGQIHLAKRNEWVDVIFYRSVI